MLSQHELINISKFFICARLVCLECRVFIAGNLEIYTVQYILLLPCQSWVRILQIFLYQNVLSFTSENKTYSNYVLCNLVPAAFLGIFRNLSRIFVCYNNAHHGPDCASWITNFLH